MPLSVAERYVFGAQPQTFPHGLPWSIACAAGLMLVGGDFQAGVFSYFLGSGVGHCRRREATVRIECDPKIAFVLEHLALNHLRSGVPHCRICNRVTQTRGKVHDQSQVVLTQPGRLRRVDSLDSAAQVREAREKFAHSFGSCSFEEPVRDLEALGLL